MPSIHDPSFVLPPKPPFRWGTSPFHARGGLFKEELAFADRVLGGRSLEVMRRTGDAALEAFLTQRFSPFDWYDTVPLLYFGAATARARGISFAHHVRELATAHAEHALSGFSGVVLRVVSNEAIATWLPRASSWYHDFGGAESKVVGPRHVRASRWGVPLVFVHAWSISAMHFTEHVLTKAGAKEPRANTLGAELDGEIGGYPVYRIGFDVTWSE